MLLLRNGKFVIWKLKSSRLSLREVRCWPSLSIDRSKSKKEAEVLLSFVSLISNSGEYIWPRLFSKSGLLMDKTSSMYLYVKLNWDANRFLPAERKDCMNYASHEYRNMSARRGAQFVPMGMPIICWKNFPAKTTKILLTRNSSILIISSSVYLFFESECPFTKKGPSRS